MANYYDESLNFNHRLKVETNVNGVVKDHREGFTQQEYFKNMQDKPQANDGRGFPPMKSVTEAPKPKAGTKQRTRKKTTADEQVEKANTKDLKNRNLK